MVPTRNTRGGSTELIVGQGFEPLHLESLDLGCVTLTQQLFADGKLSAKRFERARLHAARELEPFQATYRRAGWELAVGSSGTVRAFTFGWTTRMLACAPIRLIGLKSLTGSNRRFL